MKVWEKDVDFDYLWAAGFEIILEVDCGFYIYYRTKRSRKDDACKGII